MDEVELLAILEQVMQTQQESLDLTDKGIKELPESIGDLTRINTITFRNNNLHELPESIGRLSSLVNLVLPNNKINKATKIDRRVKKSDSTPPQL